jgi:hypothetical protein
MQTVRQRHRSFSALCRLAITVLISGLGLALEPAPMVQADTITVCHSGCDYADIQAAVSAANPGDTVSIAAGYYAGGITIDKDLNLQGAGASSTTVSGGASVVVVTNGATVSIDGVHITGGSYTNSNGGNRPSPYFSGGGGVYINEARVELRDSVVSGNSANGSLVNGPNHISIFGLGGGIYIDCGELTLINTTVRDNHASGANVNLSGDSGSGTGGHGYGGGIYSVNGEVNLIDSTVSDNRATGGNGSGGWGSQGQGGDGLGGGIYNFVSVVSNCNLYLSEGLVSLENSTVSNNYATGGWGVGGDVPIHPPGSSAGSGRGGDGRGGGIYYNNYGSGLTGLENSTVSGNTASGGNGCAGFDPDAGGTGGEGSGGGIRADTVTLDKSTITRNTAAGGGGYSAYCSVPTPDYDGPGYGGGSTLRLTSTPRTILFKVRTTAL